MDGDDDISKNLKKRRDIEPPQLQNRAMKKSFPTAVGKHAPARVIESIKGEVNKYLKRERRKKLPEGVDYWDFTCRVGTTTDDAKSVHVKELGGAINAELASQAEGIPEAIYVEILSKQGIRQGGKDAN